MDEAELARMRETPLWLDEDPPQDLPRALVADREREEERTHMPLIVCVCGGPATRGTENAYRGGCTVDTTTGSTGLCHMYDASTTSASRSQISTS